MFKKTISRSFNLQSKFRDLKKKEGLNEFLIPKLKLVSLNMSEKDSSELENSKEILGKIAFQLPKKLIIKKVSAGLKLREGMEIGFSVTCRNHKAFFLLDKLSFFALPKNPKFMGFKFDSISINKKKKLGQITLGVDMSFFEVTKVSLKKHWLWCTICVEGVSSKEEFSNFITSITEIPFIGVKNVKKE